MERCLANVLAIEETKISSGVVIGTNLVAVFCCMSGKV